MNLVEVVLQQGDVILTQSFYDTKGYPIWLTAVAMDKQMYDKTGMVLPTRTWTAGIQTFKHSGPKL